MDGFPSCSLWPLLYFTSFLISPFPSEYHFTLFLTSPPNFGLMHSLTTLHYLWFKEKMSKKNRKKIYDWMRELSTSRSHEFNMISQYQLLLQETNERIFYYFVLRLELKSFWDSLFFAFLNLLHILGHREVTFILFFLWITISPIENRALWQDAIGRWILLFYLYI